MAETFKVHGLAELKQALEKLPLEIQGKVLQGAVNSAAALIKNRAIDLAPEGESGNLKRAIYQRTLRGLPPQNARVWIGVRRGTIRQNIRMGAMVRAGKMTREQYQKVRSNQAAYGQFVEFGTVKQRPKPFMRPAVHELRVQAVERMRDTLKKRIESAARKLYKKPR